MAACDPVSYRWVQLNGRDYRWEKAVFPLSVDPVHRGIQIDSVLRGTNAYDEPEFLLENGQRVRIRVKPRRG